MPDSRIDARKAGEGPQTLAATGVKVMVVELDANPLPRDTAEADKAVAEKAPIPMPTVFLPKCKSNSPNATATS